MFWVFYLLLLAIGLGGLLLNILTLPGLWLMAIAAAVYAWITHRQFLGWRTLIALLVLAIAGEILEFLSSTVGAKNAGASRRGFWGAIIGGFLGAIILSVPLWLVGTFIGILIGTFLGALIGELSGGQKIHNSLKVGVGAAKGRFLGTMGKLAIGGVMLLLIFLTGMPLASRRLAAVPARTSAVPATTAPATTTTSHAP